MARIITFCGAVATLLVLSACTPTAEGAQQAGVTTRTAMQDNRSAWQNLFSYHPRDRRPLLPQTRYCYQMQADIVCYDGPQPNMTAKLTGYQDGASISWVQPGGGSLGVSGGEPTAPHDAQTVQIAPVGGSMAAPVETVSTAPVMDYSSVAVSDNSVSVGDVPFAKGESAYVIQ